MNPTQHAPRCSACSNPISDRYIMRITEEFYHESCLLCCICSIRLAQTCYIRDQKFYCKYDYDRYVLQFLINVYNYCTKNNYFIIDLKKQI